MGSNYAFVNARGRMSAFLDEAASNDEHYYDANKKRISVVLSDDQSVLEAIKLWKAREVYIRVQLQENHDYRGLAIFFDRFGARDDVSVGQVIDYYGDIGEWKIKDRGSFDRIIPVDESMTLGEMSKLKQQYLAKDKG